MLQITVTMRANSPSELMHELREFGNSALRNALVDMQRQQVSDNLPVDLETRDWETARLEREQLEANNAKLSRENIELQNECERHKGTIEKQKHELQNYRDVQDDTDWKNKTLFNAEYVAQKKVEANEQGYNDGFAVGYAKGRDEQIAEHAQEHAMSKPSRADEMCRIMTMARVKIRVSEEDTLFDLEPTKVCRWGVTAGGIRPLPSTPDRNDTVGIVGRRLSDGEVVFVWAVYEWTGG